MQTPIEEYVQKILKEYNIELPKEKFAREALVNTYALVYLRGQVDTLREFKEENAKVNY